MQLWWPFGTRSRMACECHPTPGTKRSSQLHKIYQSRCTAKNSWRWAERLPESYTVVIPMKLEFRASVGFIHMRYFNCNHLGLKLELPVKEFWSVKKYSHNFVIYCLIKRNKFLLEISLSLALRLELNNYMDWNAEWLPMSRECREIRWNVKWHKQLKLEAKAEWDKNRGVNGWINSWNCALTR